MVSLTKSRLRHPTYYPPISAKRGMLGQAAIAFMPAEPPPLPVTYTTPTGEMAIVEESFLSRKYGGIPVWGWIAVLAFALLVGVPFMRKGKRSKRSKRS